MPQPINYLANLPMPPAMGGLYGQGIANAGAALGQGIANVGSIAANAVGALGEMAQQQELAQQQRERQARMESEFQAAMQDGTPEAMAMFVARNPDFSKQAAEVMGRIDANRREAFVAEMHPALAAMQSGNVDIASDLLKRRLTALEAAGPRVAGEAAKVRGILDGITRDPNGTTNRLAVDIALAMDPVKFNENYKSLVSAPLEAEKARAGIEETRAGTALKQAQLAELPEAMQLRRWEVKIKANEAKLRENQMAKDKEFDDAKKKNLELQDAVLQAKIDDAKSKKAAAMNEAVAQRDEALGGIDEALDLSRDLLTSGLVGSSQGQITGAVPGVLIGGGDAADFRRKKEVLLSKLVLLSRGAMKGQGAVSDAENKMIRDAQGVLDSNFARPELVEDALMNVMGMLSRRRSNVIRQYRFINRSGADETSATPATLQPSTFNASELLGDE